MFMCKWYIYLFTHAANRFKSHVNKPSTNIVCALDVYNIYIYIYVEILKEVTAKKN